MSVFVKDAAHVVTTNDAPMLICGVRGQGTGMPVRQVDREITASGDG